MLVFIEGADGAGKSTLIKQLSDRYITAKVPKDAESVIAWNELSRLHFELTVLFDRSPLTEIIYRSVFGGTSKFSLEDCIEWLKGQKLIICDTETAFADAQRRGEDNVTTEPVHGLLCDRYNCLANLLKTCDIKVLFYDWHMQDISDVINFIEGDCERDSRTV